MRLTLLLVFAHGPLDARVAPRVAFRAQTLKDPLGAMALLFRQILVGLQDLLDAAQPGTQFAFVSGFALPIARRLAVPQNLFQRRPVHSRLAQDLALADTLHQYPPTNLCPLLHVLIHPWFLPVKSRLQATHCPGKYSGCRGFHPPAARRDF